MSVPIGAFAAELLRIHELLLQDQNRNEAFRAALERTVQPGCSVLDIGAGSGVWAMTAAKLGAGRVVAIEREPLLIPLIEQTSRANGVSVEVICGDSRNVALPPTFDVVVSETVGHLVFDEEVVPVLLDAKSRFLAPSGILIPRRVRLMVAGVCLDEPDLPAGIEGDFRHVTALLRNVPLAVTDKERLSFLTEPVALAEVDFATATGEPDVSTLKAVWHNQDLRGLNAFVVWAELGLAPGVTLRTLETSSWSVTAYRIAPFAGKSGDLEFELTLSHSENAWTASISGTPAVRKYASTAPARELMGMDTAVLDAMVRARGRATAPSEPQPPVTVRPATEDDREFLVGVYYSVREEELAQAPWSDEQKRAFVEMQFQAQHTDYHERFPAARYDVILLGEEPIGRLYVDRRPTEIAILDIALLPRHRGRGIGGRLLAELIAESEATAKPLQIWVEKFNRAQSLYRRLGFAAVEDTSVFFRMVRVPADLREALGSGPVRLPRLHLSPHPAR